MLNQETKRKIDSARDILVGKVPDPKAQVEQITTALIYKFMDDMDKEAQELGGKARFFTKAYEKYAWTKLMDAKLGGYDRLDLYIEAITSLSQNPHIPQLFRDIFKDTFLPYRNPETLSLFLKEVNGFSYDNSEDLGDAFEYLLSILGSQGDAGQFRTPRHIIDFIVAVVDPKKDETICDPACGTAGFLISAYKHILKENKKKSLTPDERKNLMDHFAGYDISPDMVRLSKVNLYLHGFPSPTIFEYDTLSSEEKWDESFDVMLANPPFMSPRGGIRPHKRFSVQASRSEVLFVDYILEHLRPKGRAGIIVPEGIIFKTETAYKELRRLLMEDGLLAVVSLPAGVFNPYSAVKTSILFFDNELAKKAKDILFIKIECDGYNLGAQRRRLEEGSSELPIALYYLQLWQNTLRAGGKKVKIKEKKEWEHAIWVLKEKIKQNSDYNLSGERYREIETYKKQKWPMVELREVLDYEQPTNYIVDSVNYNNKYKTPVLTAGKTFILGYTNEKEGIFPVEKLPVIIFDDFTAAIKFVEFPFKVKSSAMKILHVKKDKADIKFLFYIMQKIEFTRNEHKRYWISEYSKIKIPFPPIEVQKKIVAEISGYQKIIDGVNQVVKNWKPNIKIDPEWEWVKLREIAEVISGQSPESKYYNKNGNGLPFYQGKTEFTDRIIGEPKYWTTKITKVAEKNDILMSVRAPVGPINFTTQKICIGRGLAAIRVNTKINLIYLFVYLRSIQDKIKGNGGAVFDSISRSQIESIKIPLPSSTDIQTSMDIQSEIVEYIEWEREIIESNKQLIEIYEQKIADVLKEI